MLRAPLVLNAPAHLDSDLAVDGLTLLEAVHGQWRWHYPGTPYTGIPAVLLSWPQAMTWGASPITLVSGGTVAHVLLMVAVFALAWRVFGRVAAIGSLWPLTFASTGILWLSGRITGGHLLVVAWSAVAWLLFYEAWVRRGRGIMILLGVWCGLGLYLDSMFVLTLAAIAFAGLMAWTAKPLKSPGAVGQKTWHKKGLSLFARFLALVLAFLAGASPRMIGQRVEPHDAYHEQFSWSGNANLLAEHGRILVCDCLPRLVAGHRLPGLEADPDPTLLGTGGPIQQSSKRLESVRWWVLLLTVLALGICAASLVAVAATVLRGRTPHERCIAAGLLAVIVGVLGGFLINRNIFNSDNYRYLVLLLIPWAIGCGLGLQSAVKSGGPACVNASVLLVVLMVLFTCDAASWYGRLGWVDERLVPIRRQVDDPALRWLEAYPETGTIFGGYWDVYRLSFLSGGKVRGVPYPIFPDRFPEWSSQLPGRRPETLVARRSPEGQVFLGQALREGGTVLLREGGLTIVNWPWPVRAPGRQRSP